MKYVTSTFLRGLFTLLPLLLSIYVFFWFLNWVEGFSKRALLVFWPEFLYVPGMGFLIVFVLIFGFGVLVDRPLTKGLFNLVEVFIQEIPVVKTVYSAIKDFAEYLKPGSGKRPNQVVVVKFPDSAVEMIGLVTRDSLRDLPEALSKDDRVAVYFPMSYQFGGYTVFVPRAWLAPTNLGVEAALRSIITAWMPGQDKKLEPL